MLTSADVTDKPQPGVVQQQPFDDKVAKAHPELFSAEYDTFRSFGLAEKLVSQLEGSAVR